MRKRVLKGLRKKGHKKESETREKNQTEKNQTLTGLLVAGLVQERVDPLLRLLVRASQGRAQPRDGDGEARPSSSAGEDGDARRR